jgi:hypothetical protein
MPWKWYVTLSGRNASTIVSTSQISNSQFTMFTKSMALIRSLGSTSLSRVMRGRGDISCGLSLSGSNIGRIRLQEGISHDLASFTVYGPQRSVPATFYLVDADPGQVTGGASLGGKSMPRCKRFHQGAEQRGGATVDHSGRAADT